MRLQQNSLINNIINESSSKIFDYIDVLTYKNQFD